MALAEYRPATLPRPAQITPDLQDRKVLGSLIDQNRTPALFRNGLTRFPSTERPLAMEGDEADQVQVFVPGQMQSETTQEIPEVRFMVDVETAQKIRELSQKLIRERINSTNPTH